MAESQNYSESADASAENSEDTQQPQESEQQSRARTQDATAEISRLLREGLTDEADADEGTEDSEASEASSDDESNKSTDGPRIDPKNPPKTLAELSEQTGVPIESLYELAVPDGQQEGKTYTLGELKDVASKDNALTVRELQLEEQANEREAELNRMESELQTLYSLIPEKFRTPELVEQVSEQREALIREERKKAVDRIPGWKDETQRSEEIRGIAEHLKDYGISPQFLLTVNDHKVLKYIRDNWKRYERIKKTLAMVNEKFPKAKPSQATPRGKTAEAPKQSGPRNVGRQVQQISNMLRNGE